MPNSHPNDTTFCSCANTDSPRGVLVRPESELRIAHIRQLPRFSTQNVPASDIFPVSGCASAKQSRHEVIVCGLCVPVLGMFHEPCHCLAQSGPRIARYSVLGSLSKIKSPCVWWCLLAEAVAIQEHWSPDVAVKIMDCTSCTDEEISFVSQRPQCCSNPDVVVWVISCVHGDYGCRRTQLGIGKHSDEYQIGVMDPVELGVGRDVETILLKHADTSFRSRKIWIRLPLCPDLGGHKGTRTLFWFWVRRDLDLIAKTVPMCSLCVVRKGERAGM